MPFQADPGRAYSRLSDSAPDRGSTTEPEIGDLLPSALPEYQWPAQGCLERGPAALLGNVLPEAAQKAQRLRRLSLQSASSSAYPGMASTGCLIPQVPIAEFS